MMKALLLKDCYVLSKQMKMLLIMLVIFAFIPGYSVAGFAIVFSATLPTTALAYDERSKWDNLAAMMPYSKKKIVLSKYILGYFAIAAATIISLVAQIIIGLIKGTPMAVEDFAVVLALVCVSLIFISINLPFMFRFGVEKGRIIFIVLAAAIVGIGVFLVQKFEDVLSTFDLNIPLFVIIVVLSAVIVSIISIDVSVWVYEKKNK